VSLVHCETRAVHSEVIADVTTKTSSQLPKMMDFKRAQLHSDGDAAYKTIAKDVGAHEYVDHISDEYACGNLSMNLEEGYFSQLKRPWTARTITCQPSTCTATSRSSTGCTRTT
jgi:hypothetical protein